MKIQHVAAGLMLCVSSSAMATQIDACNRDVTSSTCQSYLEGIVDGALMFKLDSVGARLEASNDYESRALKYRGGKRYQEANRTYCASRIPDRDSLVSGLTEAISTGTAVDLPQLQGVVVNLLDCQRLK
ncbi:hypothetical protein [Shewanella sp.]|uniref:hypothetical protein n=1 Tax=Shewanella sp. TaxID=50422 RepID=UPI003F3BBC7C